MKKYIMLIDSLVNTFSIIESGRDILFNYQEKDNSEVFNSIQKDDSILGYFSSPINQVRCAFVVEETDNVSTITLSKKYEVSDGVGIEPSLIDTLEQQTIAEISEEEYNKIFRALLPEVDIVEDEENFFEGFATWLTSYNNPDYTGTQKYAWYPQALIRLVAFMKESNLIEDADLNDLSIEKYAHYLEVYESSEEVREFDEKKLSSKAGGAALKKYIKYIEYLLGPKSFDYNTLAGDAVNKIFFGTPGCGKSYHIDHDILGKDKETKEYVGQYKKENIIRTTFYQDYSNTDFVGQILPKILKGKDGKPDTVEYIFNPGPFTLALIRAISNPRKKVALVVEEINRGNAPAIFGDIFQLLDRDDDGVSEYGIVNVSLLDYLNDYDFIVEGKKKRYIFEEIKIPGNMDIFATMNTSDQNVYTLDTAFVRRWDKEKIKNSFADCTFAGTNVPGMDYTWQEFVTAINNHIAKHLEDLQVNEDKQIGVFFVKESLLGSTPEKFAYKVFDYLWSDVAKLDHDIFFNHFDTLEALITAYKKDGVGVFKIGIFDKKETPQTAEEDENNE